MLLEFELKGSRCLHKGVFDTNGFWVRYEAETETDQRFNEIPEGYKIFSHFSFAFYHVDESVAMRVFKGLTDALAGIDWSESEIGFIREIC